MLFVSFEVSGIHGNRHSNQKLFAPMGSWYPNVKKRCVGCTMCRVLGNVVTFLCWNLQTRQELYLNICQLCVYLCEEQMRRFNHLFLNKSAKKLCNEMQFHTHTVGAHTWTHPYLIWLIKSVNLAYTLVSDYLTQSPPPNTHTLPTDHDTCPAHGNMVTNCRKWG